MTARHGAPAPGLTCLCTWEPIDAAAYVEYQVAPQGTWHACRFGAAAVRALRASQVGVVWCCLVLFGVVVVVVVVVVFVVFSSFFLFLSAFVLFFLSLFCLPLLPLFFFLLLFPFPFPSPAFPSCLCSFSSRLSSAFRIASFLFFLTPLLAFSRSLLVSARRSSATTWRPCRRQTAWWSCGACCARGRPSSSATSTPCRCPRGPRTSRGSGSWGEERPGRGASRRPPSWTAPWRARRGRSCGTT